MRVPTVALAVALFAAAASASAQSYPNRPVRMVVPLSAGGFADVPARIIAPRLSEALGQQVFVENRPGAGATIGTDFVAKSKPDGYTLLFTGTPHVISPALYKNLPYDPLKDFASVMLVAAGPYVLVVNPQLQVARCKSSSRRPQPARSTTRRRAQHLVCRRCSRRWPASISATSFKWQPAMQDLLSGQVKVSFAGIPNVMPHVKAGKLRALAVSTPKRSPDLPDVPTVAEAGVPGYDATLWLALLAPAGIPNELVQKLYTETAKVLRDPEVQKAISPTGVDVSILGPQELPAFLQAETDKWGKVARESGATINSRRVFSSRAARETVRGPRARTRSSPRRRTRRGFTGRERGEQARLECAELVRRADEHPVDRRDAAAQRVGRVELHDRRANHHAHAVERARREQRDERQPEPGRQAEDDDRCAVARHRPYECAAGPAEGPHGALRDGDRERADSRRRGEPAERGGTDVQDVLRRSNTSARCPAGRKNRITGRNCASLTQPSASGEPVRS
jgi:tripartite-type tricarboxylate transporter receptor subunit TctC